MLKFNKHVFFGSFAAKGILNNAILLGDRPFNYNYSLGFSHFAKPRVN